MGSLLRAVSDKEGTQNWMMTICGHGAARFDSPGAVDRVTVRR